jgi:hypothetical protein
MLSIMERSICQVVLFSGLPHNNVIIIRIFDLVLEKLLWWNFIRLGCYRNKTNLKVVA